MRHSSITTRQAVRLVAVLLCWQGVCGEFDACHRTVFGRPCGHAVARADEVVHEHAARSAGENGRVGENDGDLCRWAETVSFGRDMSDDRRPSSCPCGATCWCRQIPHSRCDCSRIDAASARSHTALLTLRPSAAPLAIHRLSADQRPPRVSIESAMQRCRRLARFLI